MIFVTDDGWLLWYKVANRERDTRALRHHHKYRLVGAAGECKIVKETEMWYGRGCRPRIM